MTPNTHPIPPARVTASDEVRSPSIGAELWAAAENATGIRFSA